MQSSRATELLVGAGSEHTKRLSFPSAEKWRGLVTCDINADHHPDVVCDLNQIPWPFGDSSFDEIHAYEVLEHLGTQGDYESFFAQFGEIYRILRPGGHVFATVPSYQSPWAWGDPSHTRVITSGTLVFLSQQEYRKQVGKTPMSDFRFCWSGDFKTVYAQEDKMSLSFVLRRIP